MKIYTRKGDAGQTSLLGGEQVSKQEVQINAYGNVDELNAYLGYVRDQKYTAKHHTFLLNIQETLFTLGSWLAVGQKTTLALPNMDNNCVQKLETEIDRLEKTLPPLKNFLLPGGHPSVSTLHIARCVCRRAERSCVAYLNDLTQVNETLALGLKYLNRLSDYLFVLARSVGQEHKIQEIPWKTRK